MPINPDAIGIEYQIDLQKLANSISIAKKQLDHFHKDLSDLAKKASVTITINSQQATQKVKKFTSAIQAELDKTGMLKIKAVTESFGKIGGDVARLSKDYDALYKKFGQSPELLGKMNSAFKRVNDTIGEQALRMQSAGRNGVGFYQTANRVSLVQQELSGKLKATSTGFRNVALETDRAALAAQASTQKRALEKAQLQQTAAAAKQAALAQKELASATITTSTKLSSMGITSNTTVGQLKKMNLTALDNSRALSLVQTRMKELQTGMTAGGKATKGASAEFTRLQSMMPHLEHEANKGVKAFGDYRRAMDRWGGGFKYMMLSQAAWIASGAVLFGTLTAIGAGFKDMITYHQGMKGLEAVTQANAEEMRMLEDAINDTAVATKFFAGDMTKAAYIMAQAGFSAKEITASLGGIALLASAANSSLEDTADLMTTVIRAYELSASDSVRIANVLAAGIVKSKLEIADLRTAFNYMGVAAHQFNLSIEDTVAWLGILRDRGLKASTIGTSFRMVLATLVRDTKKFRDVLKDLKDPLGFADVTIRNGRKVEESMDRLAKAGFNVADAFVALPQRTAMTFSLMVQNTESFKKMRGEITGTNTAVEMNITQMKGLEYQLRQVKAIFTEIFRSISEGGGAFEGLVSTLKWLIQNIGAVIVYLNSVFNLIMKISSAFFAFSAAMAENLEIKLPKLRITSDALNPVVYEPGKIGLKKGGQEQLTGIVKALEKDINENRDELYKTLQRILNPDIRTSAEKKAEASKLQVNKLYDEQKKLTEQLESIGDKGSDAWGKIRDQLVLVNAQIREAEKEAGLFSDTISGPIENLQDIMMGMTVGKNMKANDLLNVFRKGEDSIGMIEEAVKKLREEYLAAHSDWQLVLSKDSEEYKRMLGLAKELVTAEKKLAELKNKRLKADLKKEEDAFKLQVKLYTQQMKQETADEKKEQKELDAIVKKLEKEFKLNIDNYERQTKELSKFEETREKFEDKYLSFKIGIDDKLADTEKDTYKRQVNQWQAEVDERKKKYNILLREAEEYYASLALASQGNPLLIGEKIKAGKIVANIKMIMAELDKLAEEERKNIADPKDFAKGMKDGLYEARETLADEYSQWKDLTKNSAMAMRNSWSDLFFDSMTGKLTSLGDYWKLFSQAVQREIANMASSWLTSGLLGTNKGKGWLEMAFSAVSKSAGSSSGGAEVSTFGAEVTHSGGLIRKMHGGGFNLKSDETLRILKDKEYVINDASTRSLGVHNLDHMNRTGQMPSGGGQTVKNFNTYTIFAMDSEGIDQALRRGGAKAISEISMSNYARERGRQAPASRRF